MPITKYVPMEGIMAMFYCALRFDGYKYEAEQGVAVPGWIGKGLLDLTEPILNTLVFDCREEVSLAAFFWLQRSFHWLNDDLTRDSREHLVFDLL